MDLNGRTLFITGVGGFIGLRAAELAIARGATVRGLDRVVAAVERARAAGVDAAVGDITDRASVDRAIGTPDVVLHTAAIVEESGDLERFRDVNVRGAVCVAESAKAAGARAFVHLSSVMVYGFAFPDRVAEDGPMRGEGNPYCVTKIESEAAVRAVAEPGRFDAIVIRPGDVYGPGSIPWVSRPLDLMRKSIFLLPDRGRGVMNHVYVDNLVGGIFAAIERDAFGETFNLTDGADTTFAEYFGRLATAVGLAPPRAVPAPLMRAAATGAAWAMRLVGRIPDFEADAVDFLLRPHPYSIEKARRELGYAPAIGLDEGIGRTAAWWRERG